MNAHGRFAWRKACNKLLTWFADKLRNGDEEEFTELSNSMVFGGIMQFMIGKKIEENPGIKEDEVSLTTAAEVFESAAEIYKKLPHVKQYSDEELIHLAADHCDTWKEFDDLVDSSFGKVTNVQRGEFYLALFLPMSVGADMDNVKDVCMALEEMLPGKTILGSAAEKASEYTDFYKTMGWFYIQGEESLN